jgi:hypothetical protein
MKSTTGYAMQSIKFSRDKKQENATPRDACATVKKQHITLINKEIRSFTRHATDFIASLFVQTLKTVDYVAFLVSENKFTFLCRMSREHMNIYINIINSLSIYTHKSLVMIFTRHFTRHAKKASRRDIFRGFQWFLA